MGIYKPPAQFEGYPIEQLRSILPYQWRPTTRVQLNEFLFVQDDENAEFVRNNMSLYVYPPVVQTQFQSLTEFSTPKISRNILEDYNYDELNTEFNQRILKLSKEELLNVHQAYVTNAHLIVLGQYPIDILARTVSSDAETFLKQTQEYIGQTALIQNGNYFIEFIREKDNSPENSIKTGMIRKMTELGRDLWLHILNYHIEYDSRLNQ